MYMFICASIEKLVIVKANSLPVSSAVVYYYYVVLLNPEDKPPEALCLAYSLRIGNAVDTHLNVPGM